MFKETLLQDRPMMILWPHPEHETDVQGDAILSVLERAAEDNDFLAQLANQDPQALAEYDLSWEDSAALLSGDIQWIEARVGKLDAKLRTWLECRLQQEIW